MSIRKAALLTRFPGAEGTPEHEPRFNIAPTQTAPVLIMGRGGRPVWAALQWGIRSPGGALVINARIETAHERPLFRPLLAGGRCLIPSDGFFEWGPAEGGGRRRPHRFILADGAVFTMAGLWRPPRTPEEVGAFVALTTRANALVGALHSRMPVMLLPEQEGDWLSPNRNFERLREKISVPFDAGRMRRYAVASAVNRADRDGPECVEPAPAQGRLELF